MTESPTADVIHVGGEPCVVVDAKLVGFNHSKKGALVQYTSVVVRAEKAGK
jgi:hypothetical protein